MSNQNRILHPIVKDMLHNSQHVTIFARLIQMEGYALKLVHKYK